jgi:hypothetical protein
LVVLLDTLGGDESIIDARLADPWVDAGGNEAREMFAAVRNASTTDKLLDDQSASLPAPP